MASDALNVAVIGCGLFGQVHVSTYARFEQSRLIAVCDLDPDRGKPLAEKYACRYCADAEEIIADESIQAVSVATPDALHRDICVKLAEAGKHFLVEKPLATNVADAQAIVDAAEAAGVVAMVDFHNRYHPALRAVKERLGGDLGAPQMLFARLSDRIEVATEWFSWSGRSGPEWFLGSHLADVACWLFAQDPVRVFAEGRKDVLRGRGIDCYDSMHIHLSFPEGFATLETSWILPNTWPMVCDFFVSVQGTEGRADVDMAHQGVTIVDKARYDRPLLFGQTPIGQDEFGFFPLAIRDFVRTVLSGEPVSMSVAEGLKNVRIIAAAVQSAESGMVVELNP